MRNDTMLLITILAMVSLYALLGSMLNPQAPDYYREATPQHMEVAKERVNVVTRATP
jgi:hypothetical protein